MFLEGSSRWDGGVLKAIGNMRERGVGLRIYTLGHMRLGVM